MCGIVYKQQDKSMLKTQYKGIVKAIRIFTDHRKGLRKNYRIYRQNVNSTSTSLREQQTGSIAKEHGF